jgi:hypothetical protein
MICAVDILIIKMKIRSFFQAGWNPNVIAKLHAFHCNGLEISSAVVNGASNKDCALTALTEKMENIFPSQSAWVVIGNDVTQPDNRVVRYKKLWAQLGIQANEMSSSQAVEWMVPCEAGVKFFGCIDRKIISNTYLLELWGRFGACWMIVCPDGRGLGSVTKYLEGGWSVESPAPPGELLRLIQNEKSFLIRDFGPTENNEDGIVIVGREDEINVLHQMLGGELHINS